MFRIFAVFFSVWLLSVSAIAEVLEVREPYVRGLPPTQRVTAAFMELVNHGDKTLRLDGASTAVAASVEIHTHTHENGVMRMRRVDAVEIPAGGRFVFRPGSYHLMLLDLQQPLRDGDEVDMTLEFDDMAPVSIRLPVRSVLNEPRDKHRHRDGNH